MMHKLELLELPIHSKLCSHALDNHVNNIKEIFNEERSVNPCDHIDDTPDKDLFLLQVMEACIAKTLLVETNHIVLSYIVKYA